MDKTIKRPDYQAPEAVLISLTTDKVLCYSAEGTERYDRKDNPDWWDD